MLFSFHCRPDLNFDLTACSALAFLSGPILSHTVLSKQNACTICLAANRTCDSISLSSHLLNCIFLDISYNVSFFFSS